MPVNGTQNHANALDARGIGKRFGGFWAVQDINLTVRPGERRAILGPNGAGKTSLFNVLTGDLTASAGTVRLFGQDVTREPIHKRIRRGLRRSYQHAHLFEGLTVRETLFLAVAGVQGSWAQVWPLKGSDKRLAEADRLAEVAGLTSFSERAVSELSHGQRRQLEIGIALAENPRVLLLDEPAAGLSPAERPKLSALLMALPQEVTVVLIEHDMEIALQTSESVSVLYNGRMLAEGTPDAIMQNEDVHQVYLGGGYAQ
ncbi:ABC transporter permease protein [Pseudooceanicola batsensis HTCC2597]|uniref:ABC transporter permease protein n=1 Tax=Pseudooceanicola batsensis (strain ATCC BAA-863 / DSM 15984 / KCTC 12145 / HTCC2597) TaxID=252305 RepID=A3U168_PSEBH|nr:ABC transporter ATP-binding protein [Pseudooceanicola batsensis]EAQ02051.1 ABC transporter permease protein [Pseudooceanicola batsensis HTCC2597]